MKWKRTVLPVQNGFPPKVCPLWDEGSQISSRIKSQSSGNRFLKKQEAQDSSGKLSSLMFLCI
jgi:hypothetical protein